jgi:hypothetical protein
MTGRHRWWEPLDRYEIECADWLDQQFRALERVVISISTRETSKLRAQLLAIVALLREIGALSGPAV